jgi:enolase
MTGFTISHVRVRGILDSRARVTVEADVAFDSGSWGRGSAPVAIAPGRREHARSTALALGPGAPSAAADIVARRLRGLAVGSEAEFDHVLAQVARKAGAGADVCLAVSLATWRAAAALAEHPLYLHLARAAGTVPALPHPLVNVFSGGIHSGGSARGFQQLMLAPELDSIREDVEVALAIFGSVERRLIVLGRPNVLSASSGLLVEATPERLLAELREEADRQGAAGRIGVGVDVAAEHLATGDGRYRLGNRLVGGDELLEFLVELAATNDLAYLEDPFAPEDEDLWRALGAAVPERTCLVGDDLFVTDARRVDPELASGIVLKPSQAGTVTATLAAARAAAAVGMTLCVSHRSGETEDTFVCDLAVAVGARFQKVGGPRRGDRTAKYNQLLRLAEESLELPPASPQDQRPLTTVEDG